MITINNRKQKSIKDHIFFRINEKNIRPNLKNLTIVNKDNFHENTIAIYNEVTTVPETAVLIYQSNSSTYWIDNDNYIYRKSDHWMSGIRTCDWYLNNFQWKMNGDDVRISDLKFWIGKCHLSDFINKNDLEKQLNIIKNNIRKNYDQYGVILESWDFAALLNINTNIIYSYWRKNQSTKNLYEIFHTSKIELTRKQLNQLVKQVS